MKSSCSEALSEKKNLQEKFSDLQKVVVSVSLKSNMIKVNEMRA